MPRLNLAAEVHRARLISRRRRAVYVLSVLVLVLVVGAWGLAFLLMRQVEKRITGIEGEIAHVQAGLSSRRDDVRDIVLFTRRLDLLTERLAAHVGWSGFLAELERLTIPPATFRTLGGSAETGVINAKVVVPTLDTAADLVASFQRVPKTNETPFTRVEVENFAALEGQEETGFEVALQLTAPPELFRVQAVTGGL